MRAIRTFVAGLHSIPDDLGLAYTLFVSATETLAQESADHESCWLDVEERKRVAIDQALNGASDEVAEAVRNAIVQTENGRLALRYREFVLSFVDANYFRTGAALEGRPVTRRQLPQALRQAYSLRSKYIHTATPLPDALDMPHGHAETADVNRTTGTNAPGPRALDASFHPQVHRRCSQS